MTGPGPGPAPRHPDTVDPRAIIPALQRTGARIESEIRGPSMGSALPDGAGIRIRCAPSADCRTGEVVALLTRRGLVAHRVIGRTRPRRDGAWLLTRGDAVALWDPPVRETTVLGVVTEWRRTGTDPWVPVAPPPPRGRGGAAADHLAVGLLDIHPALAGGTIAILIWLRRAVQRLRRSWR